MLELNWDKITSLYDNWVHTLSLLFLRYRGCVSNIFTYYSFLLATLVIFFSPNCFAFQFWGFFKSLQAPVFNRLGQLFHAECIESLILTACSYVVLFALQNIWGGLSLGFVMCMHLCLKAARGRCNCVLWTRVFTVNLHWGYCHPLRLYVALHSRGFSEWIGHWVSWQEQHLNITVVRHCGVPGQETRNRCYYLYLPFLIEEEEELLLL